MIALSLDPARAALAVQGVVRAVSVKTRPREMPEVVAVYAKNGPLQNFGRFWIGGVPSSRVLFDDEGGPTRPLAFGAVVGTAELVDVVPLVDFYDNDHEDVASVRQHPLGAAFLFSRGTVVAQSLSDQLPFLDLSLPYVALLGDAWPTTSRCPRCEGRGELFGDSMTIVGVPGGEIAYAPCDLCGGGYPDRLGKGFCDPIRVPKGLRTWQKVEL